MNEIKLLKGLFHPSTYFYQLRESEILKGYTKTIITLFIVSMLIFGLNAGFGWGTVPLSKEITDLSSLDFEVHKFYFLLGRVLLGLLYAAIILFIPSLLFWTLSEAEYKKIVVVQGITLLILLLEKLTYLPLLTFMSLNWYSSPFALGVIGQALTDNSWLKYFLGSISLFKIWAAFIQFKGLKWLTGKKNWVLLLWVAVINLLFWSITAFLAYIDFSILV
ncbi:hypothetical protein FZC84_18015 [Rossellomorea vietnamensis]|uniref:Yip1 domain-containing protein n=1 Tax=Rossellomorea vietnamensis TaxID=218284 RepID=A0A5D4M8R3_9BACI|nr:hypothetical protein [Rossellomorea vietnamensis]TYR97743.1 hypothetical protein FZC84_18015 [Rossellomorea vietnamensis]